LCPNLCHLSGFPALERAPRTAANGAKARSIASAWDECTAA